MTTTTGHIAACLAAVGDVDDVPLTAAERQELTWLVVLPGLTVADLIRAVRDIRTGTR